MITEADEFRIDKRRLVLRDSLAVASLLFGTAILFAVTLFLFHSFTAHRAMLAQFWSGVGAKDLQAGEADDAVTALRTALTYAPDTRDYQFLLAQALGKATCSGCRDESYNYFMSLWEAEPGNGSINLALARLAAQRNERPDAINFYHAAVYGTWESNGIDRRADVRLELARYLISNRNLPAARLELLTAAGNAPDNFERDMELGDLLQQADDPADAWTSYQKAIADKPADVPALDAAGHLAYQAGDFGDAHRLLLRALASGSAGHAANPPSADDRTLMENADRILELMPSSAQSPRERVQRVLAARAIAKKRFDDCSSRFAAEQPLPAALEALFPRWTEAGKTANAQALLRDPSQQSATMQLVFDTEIQTSTLCGPATGDDALLLRLATSPQTQLAGTERSGQDVVPRD